MAGKLPGNPSHHEIERKATRMCIPEEEFQSRTRKWYFSKNEMENQSPSRKDGIDHETEARLQKLYCTLLQDIGMELKVPQVTIATAMMLCHRFYLRQSHANNDWQTVATACMFLACKVEDTPRCLSDIVVVAYKRTYRWDPSAPQRIKRLEVYNKQKALIEIGERLLLTTIAFDLNIELPYKPLVAALKKLEISHKELAKIAWNFVNDWLRTTLCLQYKPHYIAAGSLFLAAKFQKVKLPTEKGKVWWLQFDVSPKQLEEVIQQMLGWLEKNRKQTPTARERVTESKAVVGKATSNNSPQSCVLSGSVALDSGLRATVSTGVTVKSGVSKSCLNQTCNDVHITEEKKLHSQTSECSSANSAIEDGGGEPRTGISDHNSSPKIVSLQSGYSKIDIHHIRETIKRKRLVKVAKEKLSNAMSEEIGSETWIERELENGIEAESTNVEKKQRRF